MKTDKIIEGERRVELDLDWIRTRMPIANACKWPRCSNALHQSTLPLNAFCHCHGVVGHWLCTSVSPGKHSSFHLNKHFHGPDDLLTPVVLSQFHYCMGQHCSSLCNPWPPAIFITTLKSQLNGCKPIWILFILSHQRIGPFGFKYLSH